jgi:hypothetical protein
VALGLGGGREVKTILSKDRYLIPVPDTCLVRYQVPYRPHGTSNGTSTRTGTWYVPYLVPGTLTVCLSVSEATRTYGTDGYGVELVEHNFITVCNVSTFFFSRIFGICSHQERLQKSLGPTDRNTPLSSRRSRSLRKIRSSVAHPIQS